LPTFEIVRRQGFLDSFWFRLSGAAAVLQAPLVDSVQFDLMAYKTDHSHNKKPGQFPDPA